MINYKWYILEVIIRNVFVTWLSNFAISSYCFFETKLLLLEWNANSVRERQRSSAFRLRSSQHGFPENLPGIRPSNWQGHSAAFHLSESRHLPSGDQLVTQKHVIS